MKSKKNIHSKVRTRLVAIAVCFALVVTVLSFGLFNLGAGVGGSPSADEPTNETGVRFVQVAAGDDFAIGLTYNGDLYGWSTRETGAGSNSPNSLGTYYTKEPRKITVNFKAGPNSSSASIVGWNNTAYHARSTRSDRIIQIAATRTTAAFVTNTGYIYTWGYDITPDAKYSSEKAHMLLLRNCSSSDSTKSNNEKEPHIINYGYHLSDPDNANTIASDTNGLSQIIPSNNAMTDISIAGGEYSYTFMYTRSNATYVYMWGSLLYENKITVSTQGYRNYNEGSDDLNAGNITRSAYILPYKGVGKVVAGGYTMGINMQPGESDSRTEHTTSLMLRGKNFITSSPVVTTTETGSGTTHYTPVNTVRVPTPSTPYNVNSETTDNKGANDIRFKKDASSAQITYEDALIGARAAIQDGNYAKPNAIGVGEKINNDLAFGRQVVGVTSGSDSGENFDYKVDPTDFDQNIYGSDGKAINVGDADLKIVPDAVSLGNDIGYGISGGVLYSWGDNYNNQNGAADYTPASEGTPASGAAYRDIPTKALNATVTNSNIFDVAAGKQLSGAKKAFHATDTFASDNVTFSEDVKNLPDYITGILRNTDPLNDDASELWVWSNNAPTPTRLFYGGVNSASDVNYYNQFVKLYSGYGNKLFAITRLGQVVMIEYKGGSYVQTIYDKFNDGTGVYDNWNVAAETNNVAANFVSFEGGASATPENPLPELGVYTITVNDGGIRSIDTVNLNSTENEYKGARKSLVTENKAGNVYRILNPDDDETNITLVPTTSNGLTSVQYSVDEGTFSPKFYWTANGATFNRTTDILSDEKVGITEITTGDDAGFTKVGNLFMYKYENVKATPDAEGDPNNTGLIIKPLQSTKGGRVKIEFYIGRYATTGDTHANEKQLFFDYKLCTFDFNVLNTPAYKNYQAFDNDGYANIPLLDPNNSSNNAFSVAVQDVSSGIEKLVEQFFGGNTTITEAIYEDIRTEDAKGFPDSNRVTEGRLDYYLNTTDLAKYNNRYQYLFADRDADLLMLSSRTSSIAPEFGSGVTSEKDTVDVSVNLDTITGDEELDTLRKAITYKFDNKYGIYGIKLGKTDENYTLEFKFDIVRFVASGSTGTLKYKAERGVSDYMTTNDPANGYTEFSYDFNEYYEYNSGFTVDTGMLYATDNPAGGRITRVFSQPSLIAKYDNVTYYGKNDGTNKISVTFPSSPNMVIGKVSEPFVINLSTFVASPGEYIMFSYGDANTKYGDFNSQFPDDTGVVLSTVALTKNQIRVTPMSTHALKFSVAIQRFHSEVAGKTSFSEEADIFADNNEKIIVTFEFPGFKQFKFTWKNNVKAPTLTSNGIIDLLARDATAVNTASFVDLESGDDFANRIYISQLQSNNTSVLTVQPITTPQQTTKFSFSTIGSGNTVVTFVLSLYDKSIMCSLPLTVSAITHISDPIELIDISYIYVNSMLTDLRRANSTFEDINNYGIIYEDAENAVYFTDATGAVVSKPQYISSVSFLDTDPALSNPRMRIEINNDANDMSGTYNLHVKYVNKNHGFTTYAEAEAGNVSILETSQQISSSRRIVPGDDGDPILTVRINTDDLSGHRSETGSEKLKWYAVGEGNDVEIRIPSAYILQKCAVPNVEDFQIFLVSASTEAAQYFNYGYSNSRDYVTIRPQKNTPLNENGEPTSQTINVSVNSTVGTSGRETRYIMSLHISVTGISETLPVERYTTIWLVAFFASFGLLFIIFLIRMIVYWRRRAKQRALIKRNQELIKMRDRIHNKSTAATREQIVRSKLKMQDPRYAKMVNDMRKERQGLDSGGAVVENSSLAFSEPGVKGKKSKKKNGKKKSIAELKAELEAKKAAFAQAQNVEPQAPFAGADMNAMPVDAQPFDTGASFDMGGDGFVSPADSLGPQDLDVNSIIFDAPDDNGQV